jgi:hypothetical protein
MVISYGMKSFAFLLLKFEEREREIEGLIKRERGKNILGQKLHKQLKQSSSGFGHILFSFFTIDFN